MTEINQSFEYQFELLSEQIKVNIDTLMISETKVDDSLPMEIFN